MSRRTGWPGEPTHDVSLGKRPDDARVGAPDGALVDIYCASYPAPPAAVTLDIDDTVDVVHGAQQLSFWNGHYGERCFLPIHVYDTATGRPVAMLLRTGKTPSGAEVAGHAMPATAALRTAEFATIRLRLIKLAARVIETATRIRVAFASACPEADTFRQIARALCPAPT